MHAKMKRKLPTAKSKKQIGNFTDEILKCCGIWFSIFVVMRKAIRNLENHSQL